MSSLDLVTECPACRSLRIARISYGLHEHTEELRQALRDGQVILGGCSIRDGAPTWHCNECGLEGGRIDLSQWVSKTTHSSMRPPLVPILVLLGWVLLPYPILSASFI